VLPKLQEQVAQAWVSPQSTFLSSGKGIWVANGMQSFKPIASSIYVVGTLWDSTSTTIAFDGTILATQPFLTRLGYYAILV
jgi:hypothetical protein